MNRRSLLLLSVSALPPAPVFAQSGSSDFRTIEIARIPEDSGITGEMAKQESMDYLFVPPIFRYQFAAEATGRIESLDADELDTLKKWGIFVARPDFVALYEHKVEIHPKPSPQWIFWQKQLIQLFQDELSQGGKLTVNAVLIGARHRRPLLVAIGFRSP